VPAYSSFSGRFKLKTVRTTSNLDYFELFYIRWPSHNAPRWARRHSHAKLYISNHSAFPLAQVCVFFPPPPLRRHVIVLPFPLRFSSFKAFLSELRLRPSVAFFFWNWLRLVCAIGSKNAVPAVSWKFFQSSLSLQPRIFLLLALLLPLPPFPSLTLLSGFSPLKSCPPRSAQILFQIEDVGLFETELPFVSVDPLHSVFSPFLLLVLEASVY